MISTIIVTFIVLLLGIAVGVVIGSLWGLSQYRHIYDWLSASLISRMQRAMRSCGYSQDETDRVTDRMGCKIMPPNIPCPPPHKKHEERVEWSEDIEAAIRLLKNIAEEQEKDYCPYNASHLRKATQYLETCRPQSSWKPSGEQMKFLWKYAEQNNYDGRILTSLYNDLKRLKGQNYEKY